MSVNQAIRKREGRNFIRVLLQSGTRANPLGDEELAIFCQCNNEKPSVDDVDTTKLIKWVNSNPECKKNQNSNWFEISKDTDAKAVVFLTIREIRCCHNVDRIFPRLKPSFVTEE